MPEKIGEKINIDWTPPVVTPAQPMILPDGSKPKERIWYLAQDFTVRWIENETYHQIIIKAGMPSDGASTPRFSWSLGFLPTGTEMGGAYVHDAAYEVKGVLDKSKWLTIYRWEEDIWVPCKGIVWSRKQCDDYFYRFLLAGGTGKAKAWTMYQALRLFGLPAWNKWWPFNESSAEKGSV
jgi:hypothetical protein